MYWNKNKIIGNQGEKATLAISVLAMILYCNTFIFCLFHVCDFLYDSEYWKLLEPVPEIQESVWLSFLIKLLSVVSVNFIIINNDRRLWQSLKGFPYREIRDLLTKVFIEVFKQSRSFILANLLKTMCLAILLAKLLQIYCQESFAISCQINKV